MFLGGFFGFLVAMTWFYKAFRVFLSVLDQNRLKMRFLGKKQWILFF
jgi:hypothetical protein